MGQCSGGRAASDISITLGYHAWIGMGYAWDGPGRHWLWPRVVFLLPPFGTGYCRKPFLGHQEYPISIHGSRKALRSGQQEPGLVALYQSDSHTRLEAALFWYSLILIFTWIREVLCMKHLQLGRYTGQGYQLPLLESLSEAVKSIKKQKVMRHGGI